MQVQDRRKTDLLRGEHMNEEPNFMLLFGRTAAKGLLSIGREREKESDRTATENGLRNCGGNTGDIF